MSVTEPEIIPPDTGGIPANAISTTPEERTYIVVTFTPMKGVDAISATRRMLKHAGRSCGLRCVNLEASGWPGITPLPSAKKSHAGAE